MRTIIRSSVVASILALSAIALVTVAPAMAQEQECTLKVAPRSGPAGTEFVFSGKGYAPTQLVFTRGEQTRTVEIEPSEEAGFTVRLIAGEGDEGRWRADAIAPDPDGCSASVHFRVTLPPTSTGSLVEPAGPDRDQVLTVMALLAALFVGTSALLLPKLSRVVRPR